MAFKNNIKIAYRNIARNRVISSINIFGLALGMMAVLLIFQYIRFEKSYDGFFDDSENIQRLVFFRYYQTGLDKSVGNNYYIGEIAFKRIPEIENFVRCKMETMYVKSGDQIFKEEKTLFADSSFFDIFSHKVLQGDKANFLRQPNMVIITQSTANKYFGDENPIGKIIFAVNPGHSPLTVQGVVEDVPNNSHLKFDIVVSLSTVTNKNYCYSCNNTNTYFKIRKKSDKFKIEHEITDLAKENFSSREVKIDFPIEFHLQPIEDIHLHSNYRFEFEANGNSKYLSILLIIALLILLSAGLNYFTIYSSIAGIRINRIGIRILNGASGINIISEFITESILTGILSLLLAFLLLFLSFPFLKEFLNLDFTLVSLLNIRTWLIPSIFLFVLSVFSGFFLGMKIHDVIPVTFLRGDSQLNKRKQTRRFLLAGQFIIAMVLIGFSIGALKQINYLQKEAFTMNIDQTLVVKRPDSKEFNSVQKSFQEALLRHPGISEITFSTISPGVMNDWVKGGITLKGKENLGYQFFQMDVASNFFEFFNVQLLAGRNFFKDETNWTDAPKHLILNREAAIAFGEDNIESLIGKQIYDTDEKADMGEVVGIIDGYFQTSLDQKIKPTIFNCDQLGYFIFIRIKNADVKKVVDEVTDEFHTYFKDQYFEYYFLDSYFNSQYKSHIQLYRCFILFSIMAVLITSLSLFGLIMMSTASRTKEIGLRKINGAKISDILYLINREFFILVTISYAVAVPVIWHAMHKWLQNFAYRTKIDFWLFVIAGIIAVSIAIITVSWQSWKAATQNPIEALKYE